MEERVMLSGFIPQRLRRALRVRLAVEGKTYRVWLVDAINAYLSKPAQPVTDSKEQGTSER